MTMTLRAFFTRLIWLCVLPLMLVAIYFAVDHVYALRTQIRKQAANQAHNVAAAIDRQLNSRIAALRVLAASPLAEEPARFREFYQEAQGYSEIFGGIVILADLSMQMLFNTRAPFGADLPKLPLPQGHAAVPAVLETGTPAVGDMFSGPIALETLIAVAVPVTREGRVRYLLLNTVETRRFQQRLDEVVLPDGWSLRVLDGKKEIIARREPPGMEARADSGHGQGRYVARSAVSHWSVVLNVPQNVYRSQIVEASVVLAALIFVATFVSVFGGHLAGRRFGWAVASLTEISASRSGPSTHIAEIESVRTSLANAAAGRKEAELLTSGQNQVLELIAMGTPLSRVLETIVRVIESHVPDMRGSILLLDPDGVHVRHGAAPGLPPSYIEAIDGQPIGPRAGSCGTAMYRREAVVAEDIMTDPLWENYRDVALEHGLRACWSTPIMDAEQRVLGSFAMYYCTPRRPVEQHLRLIDIATQLASVAITGDREEKALREAEERLRLALDAAHMGIFDWDIPRNRITWSRWHEELWGYAPGEFGGTYEAFAERVHSEDLPGINAEVERCIAARESFAREFRVVWPDGSVHWVGARGEFAFSKDGRPVRMLGATFDITARKHSEKQLRESEAMLRKLIDGLGPQMFVGLTTPDGILVEVNRPALAVANLKPEDVLGRPLDQTYWLCYSEAVQARIRTAVKEAAAGTLCRYDVEIRVAPDTYVWIDFSLHPVFDDTGRVTHLVPSAMAIHERKQAEVALRELSRQLLETEEAERRAISHELHDRLGQDLSAVKLGIDILRMQHQDNMPQSMHQRLDDLQELVQASISNTRDIMAELHPAGLEDSGLAVALQYHAERITQRHHLPITVNAGWRSARPMPVVELALFRIAQEAINNIVKHAGARNIRIDLEEDAAANRLMLDITDDGRGFDTAVPRPLNHGLRTMRERAQAVGAILHVASAPGKGTRITIEWQRITS